MWETENDGLLLVTFDTQKYDLVCSLDDGGWYIQRHVDNFVSDTIYDTARDAWNALRADSVQFYN